MSSLSPLHRRLDDALNYRLSLLEESQSPAAERLGETPWVSHSPPLWGSAVAELSHCATDEKVMEDLLLADAFSIAASHRQDRSEVFESGDEYADNVYLRAMAVAYRLYGSLSDSPERFDNIGISPTPAPNALHRSLAATATDNVMIDSSLLTPHPVSLRDQRLKRPSRIESLLTKGALCSIACGSQHVL